MTPGRDQIVLHASTAFKDALGKYATDHKVGMAEVIRRAVGEYIGYNYGAEPIRTRAPKYATPEDAKRAALERATLIRWGETTARRLRLADQAEAAAIITHAVDYKDYESLAALKEVADRAAAERAEEEETASETPE